MLSETEIQFLKDNEFNFKTVSVGYVKNLSAKTLKEYESIYKKEIDSNFVLVYWCSSCVFDMMRRLSRYYYDTVVVKQIESIQLTSNEMNEFKELVKDETKETIAPKQKRKYTKRK